jgi:hypothetical protein
MGIIEPGRFIEFLTFVLLFVIVLVYVARAKKGKVPKIRRLPALDAIEEAVGRAAEMGRPVVFSTGWGGSGLYSDKGPSHMAGISALDYAARIAARTGAKLIVCLGWPELVPVAEDTVRQSYISEGKLDTYDPVSVRFISSYQFAYSLGYMGVLMKEKAAANIYIGTAYGEVLNIVETGSTVGAVQIGGIYDVRNLPMMVAVCDYFLIGGELFAASAYLSKEPTMVATTGAGDAWKVITIAAVVLGALLTIGGVNWAWLFKL